MFTGSKFFSFSLHGALHFFFIKAMGTCFCYFFWVHGVRNIHVFQTLHSALVLIPWTFRDFSGSSLPYPCLPGSLQALSMQISFQPSKGRAGVWNQPGAAWVLLFQSRRKALSISTGTRSWGWVIFKASGLEVFLVAAEQFCDWHYHMFICFSSQTRWNILRGILPCNKARQLLSKLTSCDALGWLPRAEVRQS